jgi:translocation and assembly module TamA
MALQIVLLLAVSLQATPDAGPRILSVHLEGVRQLDAALAQSVLQSRPPRCRSFLLALPCAAGSFDWAEVFDRLVTGLLARDSARLDSLYQAWGFPDVRVAPRTERQDAGVRVIFRIDEGRPITVASLTVEGADAFRPPLELPAVLPLAEGQPYALRLLDASTQRLRALAAERGYPWAQVEVSGDVDAEARATVRLRIEAGPHARFGAAQPLTEPPLHAREIVPFVAWRAGEPFRPSRIERTLQRLRSLPVVEEAGAQLRAQPGDTLIPVILGVRPGRVHGFGVEGTVASVTCLSLFGRWQHRHLLGSPRVLTLSVGGSNLLAAETGGFPCSGTGEGDFRGRDWLLDADLWQPAGFGDGRTALRLGVFAERWSLPNAWIREGMGLRFALTHELGSRASLQLRYEPERSRRQAADLYFCGNYALCGTAQLDEATRPRWFAPVGAALLLTSQPAPGVVARQAPWWAPGAPLEAPSHWRYGLRASLDVATPASGSDYGFVRGAIEATATRVLGRTGEIAGRLRLGRVTGDQVLPPDARLYAGGLGSVRGAAQSLLGPAVLLADSAGAAACLPPRNVCILPSVDPDHFRLRPLAADAILEASLEARLWLGNTVQLAGFVDAGWVSRRNTDIALGLKRERLISPGLGLRAVSPLGPIRLDLALDPRAARDLPLYYRTADAVALLGLARYDPFEWDQPGGWTAFRRRLRLWVGVGQPF